MVARKPGWKENELKISRVLDVLKEARLFQQFTHSQLIRLIENSDLRSYPKGEIILREGTFNHAFYILISGKISIFASQDLVNTLHRKGDIFGEKSVITRNKVMLSVVAESPTQAVFVPATKLLASEDHEIKWIVYKLFVDIMNDKLVLTTNRVRGFQAVREKLRIKEEKLAQSEIDLAQKETVLQSILASMSDGVIVTSASGDISHVNNTFKKMVGFHNLPANLSEWPKTIGIFMSDQETLYSSDQLPMLKVFEGSESNAEEIFIRNEKQPQGIWLRASSRLLKIDKNMASDSLVVFHDFTKKKREELALIEAKKSAEAMAKAKSDFLSVMSHELRTPLNSILGMTDLLIDTNPSQEQSDLLNTLKASSEALCTMIGNILDYNCLEAGDLCIKNAPFSLEKVFAEIVDRYRPVAEKKRLSFNYRLDKELPNEIIGCERAVKQILRNLVDNAVKFTSRGGIALSASLERTGHRSKVRFRVRDSGIGMDESLLSRMFDPFTQKDSTYSRDFEGTGIGLSICNKLVLLLQSELEVNSQPNDGTEFTFAVDVSGSSSKTAESFHPIEIGEKPIKADKDFAKEHPLKILIGEDNPLNQKLITKILNKLGYEPVVAGDGEEVLDTVMNEKFDIVLMDLQMPKIDGVEATKRITAQIEESDRPVIIALTANVSDAVKDVCFSAGMMDYMSKPIKIDKLADLLQKYG